MNGSVLAAVVTAAVAALVAVASQLETSRRARSDRAYERRRAALVDVQEAALTLRDALRRFGADAAGQLTDAAGTPLAEDRVRIARPSPDLDRARGRLDVCGVRLEPRARSLAVATALDEWRRKADEHFLSPDDLVAAAEQQAWSDLNLLVADALHE